MTLNLPQSLYFNKKHSSEVARNYSETQSSSNATAPDAEQRALVVTKKESRVYNTNLNLILSTLEERNSSKR